MTNELAVDRRTTLLPAPRLDAGIEQSLSELTEHRMLSPARRAGYELRLVGASVLPQRQTIARTNRGTWLLVDHCQDPTAAQHKKSSLLPSRRRIPVPQEQINQLRELAKAGVKPNLAWFAHELPSDYQEGDPLPQLVPAPKRLREKDERLARIISGAVEVLTQPLTSSEVSVSSSAAVGAGYDPIILGGVKHPDYPVVGWCVLAQWDWE